MTKKRPNQSKLSIVGKHLVLAQKVAGQRAIFEPWRDKCWDRAKAICDSQERNNVVVLKAQPKLDFSE
jgi:hypothetical protein